MTIEYSTKIKDLYNYYNYKTAFYLILSHYYYNSRKATELQIWNLFMMTLIYMLMRLLNYIVIQNNMNYNLILRYS